MDFTNKKIKINSPRSKKVLLALGLDENKLYEISKKEYIDSHPELKQASEEVQDKRYEHFNNRRIKAIEDAKKARQELIDESEKNNEKEEEEVVQSTQEELIKKELEKLELIKKQQIGEIKNMIEYEYNQKEAYKKNKRKEKEREEKELKKKEEISIKIIDSLKNKKSFKNFNNENKSKNSINNSMDEETTINSQKNIQNFSKIGIKNQSVNDYMSSVIQNLKNISIFTSQILKNKNLNDKIFISFQKLLNNLLNSKLQNVSLLEFKKEFSQKYKIFEGSNQNDSVCFLIYLINYLHKLFNISNKKKYFKRF